MLFLYIDNFNSSCLVQLKNLFKGGGTMLKKDFFFQVVVLLLIGLVALALVLAILLAN